MYARRAKHFNYPTRLMISLAFTLLLVIACFRLPMRQKPRPVGWSNQPLSGSDGFTTLGPIIESGPQVSWPSQGDDIRYATESQTADFDQNDTSVSTDSTVKSPAQEVLSQKLPVLDYAELMPAIPGGIGAYYVHIEYPEEAIREGIEGLLVLTFTVNTDGSTSDMRVTRSLHPLCDSAAVQALRKTSFIPGEIDGNSVRVRMRLPVRFELIEPAEGTEPKLASERTSQ